MADLSHKSFSPEENQNHRGTDAREPYGAGLDAPHVNLDDDHPRQPSFLADERDGGRRQRRAVQHPKPPGYLVLGVRGAIFLGLVIFVALLWSFVMGMFYGRGTEFQEKGYRELTSLFYKDQPSGQKAPAGKDQGQAADKSKTSGDDVMPTLAKDVGNWLADPTPPAKPVITPQPPPEPKKIPKPAPAPIPAAGFTVQVAATKIEAEALAAVNDLKAKGFDAYFYQTLVGNSQFYRIRVGNFKNREEAIAEIGRLESCGYPKGYIARMSQD